MKSDEPIHQGQSDVLDLARANALLATLNRTERVDDGASLPPFFHQIYFWDALPPEQLGRDGHPRVGQGIVPDMGLPRRMWAGGRLDFKAPLKVGHKARKETTLDSTQRKQGRSGALAFVTLRHEIWQNDTLCVVEWQDLVYREDPDPAREQPVVVQARIDAETQDDLVPDSTLLFRYSALTFNGHRIHYDAEYARDTEGYPGLVVHGPLLAQLLMLKAQDELGALDTFAFRGVSPLTHNEHASLCRNGTDLWVSGADGRLILSAQV
ncbi:MAG: MaoC family dehydratase N-terminal domain-containing protein [Paracoccaceae bacterium]